MSVQITPEGGATGTEQKKTLEVQTFMHGFAVTAGPQKFFFPYKSILYLNVGRKEDGTHVLTLRTDGAGIINLSSSSPLDEEFVQICRHYN